jgi:hypothetical protein
MIFAETPANPTSGLIDDQADGYNSRRYSDASTPAPSRSTTSGWG